MTRGSNNNHWLNWAIKLQSLAQAGLYYTNNIYEKERYLEIRDIANQMLLEHYDDNASEVKEKFCGEVGYQTPKLDSRAVCFKDDKILLAQENTGLWSIPGGWNDIDQTLAENVVKEAKEEAGADVVPKFIICAHDWKKHISIKLKHAPFQICKIFIMCEFKSMKFKPNSETLQADFFSHNKLPKLAIAKNSIDQIDLCFKAHEADKNGKTWNAIFE